MPRNKDEAKETPENQGYWWQRYSDTQKAVTDQGIRAADKQLITYYQQCQKSVIASFEATLDHLIARAEDGKVTPADLYKLDKYWALQTQLTKQLQRLGDRQAAALSKAFVKQYQKAYEAASVPGMAAFATADMAAAQQVVNRIWCADGKSWSDRIWANTNALRDVLNDHLTECVVAGKKTSELKKLLMEAFETSHYNAQRLVVTEMAHIQTVAAQQRYLDAGIRQVMFWADPDERTCDVCGKLHKKRYDVASQPPVPAHPNCRCCIVPVFE